MIQARNRLTVSETVYFQGVGSPAERSSRFGRFSTSGEDPYQRTLKLGQAWQPLEYGWLKTLGMLCLTNEPTRRTTKPTAEQAAEDAAQVVEVGISDGMDEVAGVTPFAIILPGESARFHPLAPELLRVRVKAGSARLLLLAVPE